jgi:hypothetical protein
VKKVTRTGVWKVRKIVKMLRELEEIKIRVKEQGDEDSDREHR